MKKYMCVIIFLIGIFMFSALGSADEEYMTESGEMRDVVDGDIMTDSGEIEEVGSDGGYMTDSGEMRDVYNYSDDEPSYDEKNEGPGY
ncbi:hypothetical protein ACFL4E_02590 [Candidatus Omnitrophota bacterium]